MLGNESQNGELNWRCREKKNREYQVGKRSEVWDERKKEVRKESRRIASWARMGEL